MVPDWLIDDHNADMDDDWKAPWANMERCSPSVAATSDLSIRKVMKVPREDLDVEYTTKVDNPPPFDDDEEEGILTARWAVTP